MYSFSINDEEPSSSELSTLLSPAPELDIRFLFSNISSRVLASSTTNIREEEDYFSVIISLSVDKLRLG